MQKSRKPNPNINGPESVPLMNHVQSFPMKVTVLKRKADSEDDEVIREETIEYSNIEHRKWLGRLTYWACSSGYIVETAKA